MKVENKNEKASQNSDYSKLGTLFNNMNMKVIILPL